MRRRIAVLTMTVLGAVLVTDGCSQSDPAATPMIAASGTASPRATSPASPPAIQLPVPVAHWTFDGPLEVEKTGKIKDIKILGKVTQVPGLFGKAASFDDEEAKIQAADQPLLDLKKKATLACWFKNAAEHKHGYLFWKWYAPDSYLMITKPQQLELSFCFPTSERAGTSVGTHAPLQQGEWSHAAGVYDGESVLLYVNGKLAGQQVVAEHEGVRKSKFFVEEGRVPTELQQTYIPLSLGREFRGLMDEVMIFDVALTEAQIAKLAAMPVASGTAP
jgi:hypothetical protein